MGLWFNHEHYYEQEEKGVPEENVFTHYGLFIFPPLPVLAALSD